VNKKAKELNMSKYTTTIQTLIENGFTLFDFEYDIAPEHKAEFESLFIEHYYFHEIGFETAEMFKHNMRNRLKLIAPRYRKLYETFLIEVDTLNNYDMTETHTREVNGTNDTQGENNTTSRNIFRDTPQGRIENVDLYATDITDDTSTNTQSNITTNNQLETFTLTRKGNIGVMTHSDMIQKYRDLLIDVDKQFIEEFADLFMQIY
jgi:hypothetical protein